MPRLHTGPEFPPKTLNPSFLRYSLAKEFYDAYKKYASVVQPGLGCEQHELDRLTLVEHETGKPPWDVCCRAKRYLCA